MTEHRTNHGRWIELAAMTGPGQMVRGHFVRADDQTACGRWRQQYNNMDVYATISQFQASDRSSAAVTPFFLDIDVEADLEAARVECLRAAELLNLRIGIELESIELFFSGSKGFHLVLPFEVFGGAPSAGDVRLWRHLASRLAREGVSHADLGVYQTSRLWRLANSINSKSGLYKVPLEFKELRDLKIGDIVDLARFPREFATLAMPGQSERAIAWLAGAQQWFAKTNTSASHPPRPSTDGWRTPPCVRRVENACLPDGTRHSIYYTLGRFYATTGMAKEEAIERLREIDRRHPIRDPDYIERTVRHAWARPGFSGCPNEYLRLFCDRRHCPAARAGPVLPNGGDSVHAAGEYRSDSDQRPAPASPVSGPQCLTQGEGHELA